MAQGTPVPLAASWIEESEETVVDSEPVTVTFEVGEDDVFIDGLREGYSLSIGLGDLFHAFAQSIHVGRSSREPS